MTTYTLTALAALVSATVGRPVSRQSVHWRMKQGHVAPGTAGPPGAPPLWTEAEARAVADGWDSVTAKLGRPRGRVPGSTRERRERRMAAGRELTGGGQ